MHKPLLSEFVKNAKTFMSKHSPEILIGIGIAGMITSVGLGIAATPKALDLIEAKKESDEVDELTPLEVVKTTWKCYIPTATTCILSATCLIFSNRIGARRMTAIATAYKLSETALTEYREKVVETIGDKKEKEIKEAIDKDHIEAKPLSKTDVIVTDNGDTLCLDYQSGRYFKSTIDKINKAENELNRRMLRDEYVSLNDFYDELGLDHTKLGYDLGWNIRNGFIGIHYSAQLTDDDKACIVINYDVAPQYDYSKLS